MRRNRNGHKVYYGHKKFTDMLDELDANIARIKAEIARAEAAFVDMGFHGLRTRVGFYRQHHQRM